MTATQETRPTPKPLKVTYFDGPAYPLETLWCVWEQSRHNQPVPIPKELAAFFEAGCFSGYAEQFMNRFRAYFSKGFDRQTAEGEKDRFEAEFRRTVSMLFDEDVPVTENLTFVFLVENMPISLREQMVRHRIGTKCGPRTGADIVPDLAESSFWSQTTRVLNLSNFYGDGDFFVPEGLSGKWLYEDTAHGKHPAMSAKDIYFQAMEYIQNAYRILLDSGVHVEDARQIIPLGLTHRMTWEVNLKALRHIIGKRTCWIAQRGIWENFIQQAVRELTEKVNPAFHALIAPPCIKKDQWKSCPFEGINEERIEGRDGFPPCPLWLNHRKKHATYYVDVLILQDKVPAWKPLWGPSVSYQESNTKSWGTNRPAELAMMNRMREEFCAFWERDVDTGRRLDEAEEDQLTAEEWR